MIGSEMEKTLAQAAGEILDAAIEKMDDTLKNDPCFISKYKQLWELLREDRLKEAEEILLEIENGIPPE